ncbi:unnamed protein product [Lampetra planeri]
MSLSPCVSAVVIIMSASPSASSSSGVRKEDLVRPVPLLLRLLQSVGAKSDTFTVQQVIHHLGQYIKTKQLYDKQRQHIVHCKGDPLGEVFGVESFSLKEPSNMQHMESANTQAYCPFTRIETVARWACQLAIPALAAISLASQGLTEQQITISGSPEEEDSGAKRPRAPSPAPPCWNDDDQGVPWWFLRSLPHTLDRVSTASSTDICSRRGYETAVVTDSSDDLWFLDESNSDQFSVEFEVESIHSEDYDGEGEDGESGEHSSDDEVSRRFTNDGWRCTECSETNHPMHGYCQRCWCLRKDWLPDAAKQQQQEQQQQQQHTTTTTTTSTLPTTMGSPAAPRGVFTMPGITTALLEEALARNIDSDDGHDEIDGRRSKKTANEEDDEYEKEYEKESGAGGANNACPLLDMCIICQHEPRSCTIVHGKTGHLVTCYMCAKKLKRRNKPCPVCRSPIQAVIKTYLL